MRFMLRMPPSVLAACAAMFGLLCMPITIHAQQPASDAGQAVPIDVEFRGCESAGWCRFWIESLDPLATSLYRVRADGVLRTPGEDAISIAVRNRLNALLANMIHQAKHIELHDLRELDDGTFAAIVTVNGVNLASDPILLDLRTKVTGTTR